jgi:hypothetical protein
LIRASEQRFQLVVYTHAVVRQLKLSAGHGAPQSLFGVRHEAQDQFPGYGPQQQPLGVGEIPFTASRGSIGVRLR